jgi:transposase-like protein
MANVMNALPKSAQPAARAALKEVRDAEDREHAEKALDQFIKEYEAKWAKATEKMTKDREALLAFYAFPAEHWIHLKTTNPWVILSRSDIHARDVQVCDLDGGFDAVSQDGPRAAEISSVESCFWPA